MSSWREDSWSLRSTLDMWVSTVLIEMNSSRGDLLVGVAARDQPHHLALALGEPVEVLVDGGDLDRAGERVEHEPGQPRGEHRVALGDPADRVDQLGAGDGLGDVAAGAGADGADHVLGGVGDRQRQEARPVGRPSPATSAASPRRRRRRAGARRAARRRAGARRSRRRPRRRRRPRPTHVDRRSPSSARTPARNIAWSSTITTRTRRVVSAHWLLSCRGSFSRTSVPSPGVDRISAVPPWRAIRSRMLLRTPCRSAGTVSGSKPRPRSRTNTSTAVRRDLGVDVDDRRAGVLGGVGHGLAGRRRRAAPAASSRSTSPTVTSSTSTP